MTYRRLRSFLPALCVGLASAVLAQPNCSINIGADQTICQGQTVQLQGPPGYATYLWSTGATTQNITVGAASNYWCEVTYNSGNLVTNGNFSAGNTGFSSQWNYNTNLNGEGTYYVDNVSTPHHSQFSGTGNGNFMVVNAGWGSYSIGLLDVWCQGITVCPNQTYNLSYRARTLSNATPARLQWIVDGVAVGPEVNLPAFNGGWQTINQAWTSGAGQTSANCCLRVMSGDGVGNDFGLDDISISGTIVLRDYVQVNVTPLPIVNLGPNTTLCTGTPLLLNATVPGGTYLWQNGSTNATFNVATAGNYNVTVTANGCSNSDAITVNYNPYPVVNLGADFTLCAGQQQLLTATQPGATYSWQNNSTASTFNVTGPGTYDVDVTVGGCTTNDAITVSYNPLPVVALGADQVICEGTPLQLNASLPGATYVWQDGSTAATFDVVASGPYDVDVTLNGCSASDAINVTVNPNPVVDLGADVGLCQGDQILLDATLPGATYLWQDNSTAATFNATSTGTYDVDVTVNGCTTNDAININFNPVPVVALGPDLAICQGDPLQLDATVPGATYLWQDGSTAATFDVTVSGPYDVTVTLGSCVAGNAINVIVNPNPVVDLGADVALCQGDQLLLDGTLPGATYLWQDNSTAATFNATSTGTFDVDVTVNGCTTNDAINVTFNPVPVVALGPDLAICQGDPLQLDATVPGATYLWQDGSTAATFDVTASGPYDVTVTLGSCVAGDAINVVVNPNPVVDLGADVALCQGDQILLDATLPGATYLWQDNSTAATFNATSTGTFDVDVTVNGCTTNDAINVTFNPVPVVALGPDLAICQGDPLQLDATVPGATYLWQDGSTDATFDVTASGPYDVTVTLGSCVAGDAINVVVNPKPVVDLGADATLCQGDQLLLDATLPGATYLWQDNSTAATFNATSTGTYDVDVTVNGCTTNDAIDLTFNPTPVVDLGLDLVICEGDPIVLDATEPGATYLWQDGTTAATLTLTTGGSYAVTVTLGNCSASDAMDVVANPYPVLDLGPDVTLCDGEQLLLDATVPGATYLWQDNSTAATLNVGIAGNYNVRVEVNGCTTNDAINVNYSPAPVVALGPDLAICQGTPLQLDATVPGATYLWQDGSTDATFDVTTSGPYDVTVTLGSCVAADAINVIVNPNPVVDLGADVALCLGDQLLLNAALPGATYLWQDNSTTSSFNVTSTGTYDVDVTVNGCTTNDAINVNFNPVPVVALGPDLVICQGDPLQLDATVPGATYLWQNGSTDATFDVTTNGPYDVTVTLGSCVAADAINVIVNPNPVVYLGADVALCLGDQLLLNAALPGATYLWQDNSTAATFNVTGTGTYDVDVTVNGCTTNDAITVNFNPVPVVAFGPDLAICQGDPLQLDATVPGATYLWQDGSTDATFDVTASGPYDVTVTLGSCIAADAINVIVNPNPLVDLGADVALCLGDQVLLDAALPGATYLWQDNSTAATFNVTGTGTYDVDVTVNGCTTNDAINVNFNPVPVVAFGPDLAICQGTPLQLDATVPGATYLWQDGSTDATFDVTASGPYDVTVTLGSCIAADAINVIVDPNPVVDLGNDTTLCPNAVLLLDASAPGMTYLWQDGSTAATHLVQVAGTYSVTITNPNLCSGSDAINVAYSDPSALELGPDVSICDGTTLTLDATLPGSTYLWSTNATDATIDVTVGGDYAVEVFQGGCSVVDDITVTVLPSPTVDLGPDTTLCDATTLTLDATFPGATYQWSTGSTTSSIDVSTPATYDVSVDLNGCFATDAITVVYVGALTLDLGNDTALCPGADLDLYAWLPGGTTVWSTNVVATSITVSDPDIYWATITVSGCAASDSITVDQVPLNQLDLGQDAAVCEGNSMSFDITVPGATYLWDDGTTEPNRTVSDAGEYWAHIMLSGCMTTDTINLALVPLPVVDLGPDTGLCAQNTLLLDATMPGGSYLWSEGSTSATINATYGDWNVQVTVNGCSASDAIHIDDLPTPAFSLPVDTTLCTDMVWMIDAVQANASYLWQDGSTTSGFLVDHPGNYSATVSIGGCAVSDAVEVSYFDDSLVDLGPDTVLCPGEELVLTLVIPEAVLLWPDGTGGSSYTVTSAGNYTVFANADGCSTSDDIQVSYTPLPQPDLGADRTLCEGDSLMLSVQPATASVLWSTGSPNDSLLVTSTGDIAVTLTLDGCTSTDVAHITFLPVVDSIDLGPDATICLGEALTLDATTHLALYGWNTGSDNATIQVTMPGIYHVVLSGPCINATDTITITEGNCAPFIYVPNSFTPNSDGINDVFAPATCGSLRSYTFLIFDRWGGNIFTSDTPGEPWDGTLNGTPVQDGVYVWSLTYKAVTDEGVKQERLFGSVTLLR